MDGHTNLERPARKDVSIAPAPPADSHSTYLIDSAAEAISWRWAAATALLTRHGPRLQRCARRCLAWRQRETDVEPEDLVEAALVKFLDRTVGRQGSEEQLVRCMCAVIYNLSRDVHKFERKFAIEDETDLLPAGGDPNDLIELDLLGEDEEMAIRALPPMMRVLLFAVLGLAVSVVRIQETVSRIQRSIDGRAAEGPPIGTQAPELTGKLLIAGTEVPADLTFGQDVSRVPTLRLVWFMAVSCKPCNVLRPLIRSVADEYRATVTTVVSCVGNSASAVQYFGEGLGSNAVLLHDVDRRDARRWLVSSTPFAIIADRHGIVRKKFAAATEEQVRVALEVLASQDGHKERPKPILGKGRA